EHQKDDNGILVATINSPFGRRDIKESAAMGLLHRYIMNDIQHASKLRSSGEITLLLNEEKNFIFNLRGHSADISADVIYLFEYFSDIELSHEKTQGVKLNMLAEIQAAPPPTPFDTFINDVFIGDFDR